MMPMSETKLYRAWSGMKARCENPNSSSWHRYGGRGIAVCPEWHESFPAFCDWALANGYRDPAPGTAFGDRLSLDRIDVNGNYEPGNCRWIPFRRNAALGASKLTDRQRRVIPLLAVLEPPKVIASRYKVTPTTVRKVIAHAG